MTVPDQPAGRADGPSVPASPPAATQVGTVLARLDDLERLALHEHPDLYQAVHSDLQSALAAIDDA